MAAAGPSAPVMESRVGRDKQRYNSRGERLVAGVVPVSEDGKSVLMIQSARRKGWVLPKGGWEIDEECVQAAEREAWEEAGIFVAVDYDLGDIIESRPPKKNSSKHGGSHTKCLYRFYQVSVVSEEAEWPERDKRERQWMSYAEAKEALKDRPELKEALDRSTIKKS